MLRGHSPLLVVLQMQVIILISVTNPTQPNSINHDSILTVSGENSDISADNYNTVDVNGKGSAIASGSGILSAPLLKIANATGALGALAVGVRAGEIHGVEVLARWKRCSGIFIPPDVFIPQVERSELIIPLTRQLMARTATDLAPVVYTNHFILLSTSAVLILSLDSLLLTISDIF